MLKQKHHTLKKDANVKKEHNRTPLILVNDLSHHIITDAGISLNHLHVLKHMTPSNTPQKCFDRWQRGVNRIISIHHRTAPDRYTSVFLSRSHCTNLIRSDPADPKTASQNNPDSVPGTGTLHPEEICSALSVYLTFY